MDLIIEECKKAIKDYEDLELYSFNNVNIYFGLESKEIFTGVSWQGIFKDFTEKIWNPKNDPMPTVFSFKAGEFEMAMDEAIIAAGLNRDELTEKELKEYEQCVFDSYNLFEETILENVSRNFEDIIEEYEEYKKLCEL